MSTLGPTDVEKVVEQLGHERVRWLVSDANPHEALRASWRAEVLSRAGKLAPVAQRRAILAPLPDCAILAPLPDWSWVTTADLVTDAGALVGSMPPDTDLVVGVARSGIAPAFVVAHSLHVSLWSVSGRDGLHPCGAGERLRPESDPQPRRVAVVDDTIFTGLQQSIYLPIVKERWPEAAITRAVVYSPRDQLGKIDVCVRVSDKHYLDYHSFNSSYTDNWAFDCDGVLCEDCPAGDDDDGPRYRRFLRAARPLFPVRKTPCGLIVTARHERYRPETEAWLAQWGIRTKKLVMRDFPIDWGRGGTELSAAFKAEHYGKSGMGMFVESDPRQAQLIAEGTGKPVLCPAARKIWPPAPRRPTLPTAEPLDLLYPWGETSLYCAHRQLGGCRERCYLCGPTGRRPRCKVTIDDCRSCLSATLAHLPEQHHDGPPTA